MGHSCVVPGCNSKSYRDSDLSFFRLPLRNKTLLRKWLTTIGKKRLPESSRICSLHFKNGKNKGKNEISTINLSKPVVHLNQLALKSRTQHQPYIEQPNKVLVSVNTDDNWDERVLELEAKVNCLETQLKQATFSISRIINDDDKVRFYTGFPSRKHFVSCFKYLGPCVNSLHYWGSHNVADCQREFKCGPPRKLSPVEEFFMTLCRQRLGLFEEDLADRFGVHPSSASRIFITWVNFLYFKFKDISLWPSRAKVQQHMPECFKKKYPTTRVIIDATEVKVVQPSDPAEQQMTFSSYKNTNTFKSLIGITPSGAICFVSSLYSGSISDKELTRQSGLLPLLEKGDSVMADKGFDISDLLLPLDVSLNIPPFLRGKPQLDEHELIETRRIASLRIHVERAIECIKNFHFFDRQASLACVADQAFFVCAVITNFYPPLVE